LGEVLHLADVFRSDVVVMDIRLPGLIDAIQAGIQIWAWLEIPEIYIYGHVLEVSLQHLGPAALTRLLSKNTPTRDLH
jgi:hypothetical protein